MALIKTFTHQDIQDYYHHTETHYRKFWNLEQGMGLHYGIWDDSTRNLTEAVMNTNARLAMLGQVRPGQRVLDAGCGVGGSSIFLAKNFGCQVTGITLSERQVRTAGRYAERHGVAEKVDFQQLDYASTSLPAQSFDIVWAIESMQTAHDKAPFLREAARLLKPDGKLLIADVFKEKDWHISDKPAMQTMLNGWAMSDILSLAEIRDLAERHTFARLEAQDVTSEIVPSIRRMYWAGWLGMFGTKWYNLWHKATPFSKINYKTGLAQYEAWREGLWGYYLICLTKQ